jgi:hypothetical protein
MDHDRSAPVRSWVSGPTTCGITSPARWTITRSPDDGRGGGRRRAGDGDGAIDLRERGELEGGFGDDGEGAEGADVEFVEVVAADVLHDAAAGLAGGAIGVDDADAEEPVADRAVAVTQRTRDVRGEETADSRPLDAGRIEGEPLAVPREEGLQVGETHAGFDGDGHVGGFVSDDAVEARGGESEIVGLRRIAEMEVGTATDRNGAMVAILCLDKDALELDERLRSGKKRRGTAVHRVRGRVLRQKRREAVSC